MCYVHFKKFTKSEQINVILYITLLVVRNIAFVNLNAIYNELFWDSSQFKQLYYQRNVCNKIIFLTSGKFFEIDLALLGIMVSMSRKLPAKYEYLETFFEIFMSHFLPIF